MKDRLKMLCILIFSFLLVSCEQGKIFDSINDFNDSRWDEDNTLSFSFEIEDTNITYDIFYTLRNKSDYRYQNLYVKYQLLDPDGEIVSYDLHEMDLFQPKTGKPKGKSGFGSIYSHEFLALKDKNFDKTGEYTMNINQYMRTSSLTEMVSFGLKIKKSNP
ncbi:MAG: gliding motility lipoprotein GldH [Cyclobacteriaceae bacterium]|nr:gliding motility lipoprotein GldH [Cyclobacteriaceae bacterium]MCH8516426.1 gliding motility lipoprotein GldH [Cyclobacteriaceae bacterium]